MGGSAAKAGDAFACFRAHSNKGAVSTTTQKFGAGRDLDDAVIAATNKSINNDAGLMNIISLSFACENLPNMDTFTRSDAMCVLFESRNGAWHEIGRTEVIMDNLNPRFVTSLSVQYKFEEQ